MGPRRCVDGPSLGVAAGMAAALTSPCCSGFKDLGSVVVRTRSVSAVRDEGFEGAHGDAASSG